MPSVPQWVLHIPTNTKTGGRDERVQHPSAFHTVKSRNLSCPPVPFALPSPQSDANLKQTGFSNHSTSPSISFSQNHQKPKGTIKVKRDIFPSSMPINTVTSQGHPPAFCFGTLLWHHAAHPNHTSVTSPAPALIHRN